VKLDDRFDALARTEVPDLWHEIAERKPRLEPSEGPSVARRIGIVLLAFLISGVGFAFALRAYDDRQSPGTSPTPSVGGYSIQTVLERTGLVDVAFGEGSAWATTLDSVVRLDATSGRIQADIPVDKGFDIAVGEGGVWVTRNYEGGIDVVHIDPATNQVVAHIPVSSYCVAVGEGAVWTTSGSGSDLIEIDPTTDEVVTTIPIDPGADGRGVGCVAVGDGGVWVTRGGERDALLRIDPQTHEVAATIDVPNDDLGDAIVADSSGVWVAVPQHWNANGQPLVLLHRVDPSTNQVTASVPLGESSGLGSGEHGASMTRIAVGDGLIWVETGSYLFAVDPISGDVVATFPSGSGGSVGTFGLAVGDGAVWSVVEDTVRRGALGIHLSPAPHPEVNLGVTATTDLGKDYAGSLAYGEGSIWVAVSGAPDYGGKVLRIDPATNEVIAEITTDVVPSWEVGGGGITVAAGSVWLTGPIKTTERRDGSGGYLREAGLVRIDPATNQVVTTIRLGGDSGSDVVVTDEGVWTLVFANSCMEVAQVDPATGEIVRRIELDATYGHFLLRVGPYVVAAVNARGDAGIGETQIVAIDPTDGAILGSNMLDDYAWPASDGSSLWLVSSRGLDQIDPATGAVVAGPYDIAATGDALAVADGRVWFLQPESGRDLAAFLVSTLTVDVHVDLPPSATPIAIALSPDSAWVLTYEGQLLRVDLT
jgi:hypothetical protein